MGNFEMGLRLLNGERDNSRAVAAFKEWKVDSTQLDGQVFDLVLTKLNTTHGRIIQNHVNVTRPMTLHLLNHPTIM